MPYPIHLLVLEDDPMVRTIVRLVVTATTDIHLVGETANLPELPQLLATTHPHVLLHGGGVKTLLSEVTLLIASHSPYTRLIALLQPNEVSQLTSLLAASIHGCCLRSEISETLPTLIRSVAADVWMVSHATFLRHLSTLDNSLSPGQWLQAIDVTLTTNERRVLTLLVRGLDNATIAYELHLAEQTVRNLVHKLYGKLNMNRRAQLVAHFQSFKGG